MPECCAGRPFHRNHPIVRASGGGGAGIPARQMERRQECLRHHWIIYCDGGWPWGMDGEGAISLEFTPPANSRQPERELPTPAAMRGAGAGNEFPFEIGRADDFGFGFAAKAVDLDGDGSEEVAIYDRRFLWWFRPA